MSLFSFTEKLELNGSIDQVFSHFIDTDHITSWFPSYFKSQLISRTSRRLTHGTYLEFQSHIFGIPTRWKTYIHSFSPNRQITCVGQKGLISSWEHDCYFEALSNQRTRVTECLLYHLPFGQIGNFTNRFFIQPYLKRFFKYHQQELQSLFDNKTKTLQ